ncbi:MAG: molybdopterin molybdenumtransferase MoeA [Chloroflexi bacterium]|nr:molybdopterin molybdenumtransferase MoeA [Chloroflexota bacterium]
MPSPEFFQVMPVSDALRHLETHWQPGPQIETITTADALDRVLAAPIASPEQVPAFRKSTVDGYALRAADTFGASQSLPAFLTVGGELAMGEAPALDVGAGEALLIHTGGMLPTGADAVAMVEHTQAAGAGEIEVLRAAAPGENVIHAGEDIGAGERILPARRRLRSQDIGGLLAVGIASVDVLRQPRVGILSCGDELLPPEAAAPPPGKVRDINAYTLSALARKLGARPLRLGIASDDFADYQRRARDGIAACDILLLSAGSSVSERDYTRDVIDGLGQPGILQHGLAVKPGKPTILALCDNKPVIGLPGNPVSALLVARQLLPALVARYCGQPLETPRVVSARLTQRIASVTGREDWVALRLSEGEGGMRAEPVFGKSNLIFTLVAADALLRVPLNAGGYDAGALVDVELF